MAFHILRKSVSQSMTNYKKATSVYYVSDLFLMLQIFRITILHNQR